MDDKFYKYYTEIYSKNFLFNRNEILLKQLDKITKDDLIEFVKKYINPENRIKIIINGN